MIAGIVDDLGSIQCGCRGFYIMASHTFVLLTGVSKTCSALQCAAVQ